ncbi:hypothetical protein WJU16_00920 [Chitinophaga pollutisoli]|uniref:DUF898 family protein n=1 Tax=Chitinophaga pollutisoli TaxID=3133966 RepID=A0ABZ2YRY1_9BACT
MQNQNLFELHIDDESASYLRETAKWGRFLSIFGFICLGFYVLLTLFLALVTSSSTREMEAVYGANPMMSFYSSGIGMVVMLAYMGLLFIPLMYMYRFSTRMKTALAGNDQITLTNALGNLKSMFKFWGIFTIVVLSLVVLGFILMMFVLGANIG